MEDLDRPAPVNRATGLDLRLVHHDAWRHCTGPSLRGHVVNAHFEPHALVGLMPTYDAEVAQYRGIGMGWVARKALERAVLTDEQLADLMATSPRRISPEDYRNRLIKTAGLLSDMGLATVEWSEVDRLLPGASDMRIEPSDPTEQGFYDFQASLGSGVTRPDPEQSAKELWALAQPELRVDMRYVTAAYEQARRRHA